MPTSVTDLRSKFVLNTLSDLYSEISYGHDLVTQLGEPLGFGESIEVPGLDEFEVADNGTTGQTAQSINANSLVLTANREPFVNVELTLPERVQGLEGQLGANIIRQTVDAMKFAMDRDLMSYLVTDTANDANNRVNAGAATASLSHVALAKGKLLSNRGEHRLSMFVHPMAEARYGSIVEFHPDMAANDGALGIPFIGMMQGVPVYVSNAVPYRRQIASSAWDVTSDVLTINVPLGHGVQVGTLVTFDTVTAGGDLSTAAAVTAVSATTIEVDSSGLSDGSATEVGAVTVEAAENIMVDAAHCFVAQQLLPTPREVPVAGTSKSELQLSALWGFVARPGRAVVIETEV